MFADFDIETLKVYFENRKDVAFAFLFGSQARRSAKKLSDIDIALYFYPERRRPVEFEEEIYYKGEDEIWTEMERAFKRRLSCLS
jgi:predicted nucleotidyltransferase